MSKDLTAVRNALFETLEGLRNKEQPMDLDRARAINEVAGTLIESAKVEVAYMKISGTQGSGFIPETSEPTQALPGPQGLAGQVFAANVRTHRLRG